MNLEQMTKEYNLACAKAVKDTIHELAEKWGPDLVSDLNEQRYEVCVELYDQNLCIYAYVGKDDYFGPIKYKDDSLNEAVQEAFDNLGLQVILNAMLYYGMEDITQTIYWRIY